MLEMKDKNKTPVPADASASIGSVPDKPLVDRNKPGAGGAKTKKVTIRAKRPYIVNLAANGLDAKYGRMLGWQEKPRTAELTADETLAVKRLSAQKVLSYKIDG
jgi:hypothetical protein